MKILALLLALVSGCAVIAPENEIRVTEYTGSGSYLMQAAGQAAGCRAVQTGAVDGCMLFKGAKCSFVSKGCEKYR